MLHVTYDLDSVGTEVVIIPGELQSGSGDIRHADPSGLYITGIVYDFKIVILYNI